MAPHLINEETKKWSRSCRGRSRFRSIGICLQSPCWWLQGPRRGIWAASMMTRIYSTQTDPLCMSTSFSNSKSKSPPFSTELEWKTAFLWAQRTTSWEEHLRAAASPYTPCPPPFLGPLSHTWWGHLLRHHSEDRANRNTWRRTQPDQSIHRILKIILKDTQRPYQRSGASKVRSGKHQNFVTDI